LGGGGGGVAGVVLIAWAKAGPLNNAHAAAPIKMVFNFIFFPAR
jgi:hypothetical protein